MTKPLLFDAGILGMASHPRKNLDFAIWFDQLLGTDTFVVISEVADYEIRRELLRASKPAGITRLDQLKENLFYLPISTSIMLRAAQLWAEARNQGKPTADRRELDCDVILAASALEIDALVITDNIGHLSRFVETKRWSEFVP
jgi:predicted nucleic acid-binding protein